MPRLTPHVPGMRDLGEYVREQRENAQLSVRQLSAVAGISNPYLSQIERGLRRPSADILNSLARGLQISAESLYVQAGLLDESREASAVDVRLALSLDRHLTDRQRRIMIDLYDSFVPRDDADEVTDGEVTDTAAATKTRAAKAPTTNGRDAKSRDAKSRDAKTRDAKASGKTRGTQTRARAQKGHVASTQVATLGPGARVTAASIPGASLEPPVSPARPKVDVAIATTLVNGATAGITASAVAAESTSTDTPSATATGRRGGSKPRSTRSRATATASSVGTPAVTADRAADDTAAAGTDARGDTRPAPRPTTRRAADRRAPQTPATRRPRTPDAPTEKE